MLLSFFTLGLVNEVEWFSLPALCHLHRLWVEGRRKSAFLLPLLLLSLNPRDRDGIVCLLFHLCVRSAPRLVPAAAARGHTPPLACPPFPLLAAFL